MFKRENLRKNFLRVKQIADQNLGRAEKSEVLSEDQQENERRADIARQICHNLTKKIAAILEAPPGTDAEKRLKKLPETGLSNCLIESSILLGQDTLLGHICQMCGECEGSLAQEELQCELAIEEHVLTPLQAIAEVEIPNIMKLRKQLNKSTLDMDSAKSRFNSAVRQSHVPGANMASAAAKADAVRDEYDEAVNKVENIKDNLSIELCNFIARESERSSTLVSLLEAQAAYHKKALMAIEGMIPKMKAVIEASQEKPVFGMSLEEHLCLMKRDISFVLEVCILMLLDNGMEEEGLFRIAGAAIKSKKLRACIDAHSVDMEDFINDPHTVAGVLKQYLRELPEPLLTYNLYSEFMQATQLPVEQRLNSLQTTLNRLPPANFNNLRYLMKFLALLAEKSSLNKMTPSNIAIVIGPNLLWSRGETAPNMMTAGAVSAIIEAFIIHADRFFPGEIDFALTAVDSADSPGQEHTEVFMSSSLSAHPPVTPTSPAMNNVYSPLNDSPEAPPTSPKAQRRIAKKPAPPPPPDRSYNVAVTASVSKISGNSTQSSQTWPRSAPLASPESPPESGANITAEGDRHKHSPQERRTSTHGGERPHGPPPDRPNAPPPDRPKGPSAVQPAASHLSSVQPSGHQRSASAGAIISPGVPGQGMATLPENPVG